MNKKTILKVLNEFAEEQCGLDNEGNIKQSFKIDAVDFPAIADRLSQDWVKVEDRLPEFGKHVLVYGEKRILMAQLNRSKEIKSASGPYFEHEWSEPDRSFEDLYITVTHWQPLPELPSNPE